MEGEQIKNSEIVALAEIFHEVPLRLEEANKGARNYNAILDYIKARALQNKTDGWLNNAIIHYEQSRDLSQELESSSGLGKRKPPISELAIIVHCLYLALIEIRLIGYEIHNEKISSLADLFHTIPLRLSKVSEGKEAQNELLLWLQNRARENNCEDWLNQAIYTSSEKT